MWCVSKEVSRNCREIMHGFREIVCVWLLLHLLPQSCCDGKQALLVLLVEGVCKFDRDLVSKVRDKLLVAISLGDAWDISRIRLLGQSVLALILNQNTAPKVSTFRPDYLFRTVIGA